MFDAFDIRGEGRIDTADFGRALANYEYARLSYHPVFFN